MIIQSKYKSDKIKARKAFLKDMTMTIVLLPVVYIMGALITLI